MALTVRKKAIIRLGSTHYPPSFDPAALLSTACEDSHGKVCEVAATPGPRRSFEIRPPDAPFRCRFGVSNPAVVRGDPHPQADPIPADRNQQARSFCREIVDRNTAGVAD